MSEQTPPPTAVKIGEASADVAARLRIVDAATGATIDRVVEADSVTGKIRRMAVENGNLIREGDRFKVIDEDRAIRIEWIEPETIVDHVDEPAAATPLAGA
ncbi:hypothetical protein [Sphingomonas sp. CROZ-RG-20F-R02-07]|uniref:hypothetical protein n=1 Tax=Sphingomonas sp. CROZ-RG-20F-R02-07 TaxID=2914832 RepID=UPI001F5942B0|nr:hypothetical protein [Sphingomonas sp. CROZ-RG-20F-R02-07]